MHFVKQQNNLVKNYFTHYQKNSNKDTILTKYIKKNKIKENQNQLKKMFQYSEEKNKENILENKHKTEPFLMKLHNFEKGDYVYSFVLDIEKNNKPFQEGIVSQEYSKNEVSFLPISIKGKNNKIFFNQQGDFIGISLPFQHETSEINYIITTNYIYYFLNCYVIHYIENKSHKPNLDLSNLFEDFKEIKDKTKIKYFLKVILKTKDNILDNQESVHNEEKDNKIVESDICIDENGFFLGIKYKDKFINVNKLFQNYSICSECYKKMINYKNEEPKKNQKKEDINDKNFSQDSFKEKIKELSLITFLVRSANFLGSGFIYKVEKLDSNNKYKYYVLTNRHVIFEENKNNISYSLYNKYFGSQQIDSLNFIHNKIEYDDIGIVTFEEDINNESQKKFQKVTNILKYAFPKEDVEIIQGEDIYSMGCQMSFLPKINLIPITQNDILNQFIRLFSQNFQNTNLNMNDFLEKIPKHYLDIPHIVSAIELNLLKKGSIIYLNNKDINFNIKIDGGNSGGPVFNQKGQIIGMNRSIIKNSVFTDEFSQSIDIRHIKSRLMKERWKEQDYLNKKNINFLSLEIENFKNHFRNHLINSKKKEILTIFIEELYSFFREKQELLISNENDISYILVFSNPYLLGKKENQSKFNINLITNYDFKDQIFSIDPSKENINIELSLDSKKEKPKFVITFKKINLENPSNIHIVKRSFNIDDFNSNSKDKNNDLMSSFLSLELFNSEKKHELNENYNDLEKIKKSFIVWKKEDDLEGNGIIFHKEKLKNNNFLYFVLSNYNTNDLDYFNKIKNFFSDSVELMIYQFDSYRKEKTKINSFYSSEDKKLALMTFESNCDYDIAKLKLTSELSVGEKIYFLINIYNENYYPQIFKSNIGSIFENKNTFLFDSVFDLKTKKFLDLIPLNFLCFDKEGNFIGFNDMIKYNKSSIPSHFIQCSFLKQENLVNLFIKSKLKENFNIIFTLGFLLTVFFILIKKIPIYL
jgi:hypothetical protein